MVALTLLAHPGSLLVVTALSAGWLALLARSDAPLVLHGRAVARTEQLAAAGVFSLGACGTRLPAATRCLTFQSARVASHALTRAPCCAAAAAVLVLFTRVAALLASALSLAAVGVAAHASLRSPDAPGAPDAAADGAERGGAAAAWESSGAEAGGWEDMDEAPQDADKSG